MASTTHVCYVYGIVPSAIDLASAPPPPGVDDARVALEPCEDVAALMSAVDSEAYAPSSLERSTADVEWMSPRAVAHDRVLTWASDRGGGAVVPMPMFSLFTGPAAVQHMLRERSSRFEVIHVPPFALEDVMDVLGPPPSDGRPKNRLLAALPAADFNRLRPLLKTVPIRVKTGALQARRTVSRRVFPEWRCGVDYDRAVGRHDGGSGNDWR